MKQVLNISLLISILIVSSCAGNSTKQNTVNEPEATAVAVAGPQAIIYKTSGNYNNMVPVIMNADKSDIASFPAPGDLKYKGKPALPTQLEDGFLLDNRGITENVAFLNITYDEYMALAQTPSKDELFNLIIDRDPLLIMYACGMRQQFTNEVEELNTVILENDFSAFKKLK